jgi:hypothetical protein
MVAPLELTTIHAVPLIFINIALVSEFLITVLIGYVRGSGICAVSKDGIWMYGHVGVGVGNAGAGKVLVDACTSRLDDGTKHICRPGTLLTTGVVV